MGKEMIFFRDSCTRVKDLERENKELVKQATIDKKTLITLREVRIGLTVSEDCKCYVLKDFTFPNLSFILYVCFFMMLFC